MATLEDVRRIALTLPEVTEAPSHGGQIAWKVRDKSFVWERPLRGKDLEELGDDAPPGEIMGLRVADLDAKDELLRAEPDLFFITSHFDGYPAVLLRLDRIAVDELTEVVTQAWFDRAPKRLAAAHRATRPASDD